jgi:hypothetical protein
MTIPSRFSKSQFDSVAWAIGKALDAYPRGVLLNPGHLSVETLARKVREGLTAKAKYGHANRLVDEARFKEHASKLITSMSVQDGQLWVGPKDALDKVQTSAIIQSDEVQVPFAVLEDLAKIWTHLVPRPTNFMIKCEPNRLLQPNLDALEAKYEIGFLEEEPGKWRLI